MSTPLPKSSGLVVWQDGTIVAVLTGIRNRSANPKTGDMLQLWVLRKDRSPIQAVRDGSDSAICGDCPLRGVLGKGRTCYVNPAFAPGSVWRAYRRGAYPEMPLQYLPEFVRGRAVRLGAYGDPGLLPVEVLRALTAEATSWTGYTHQWRTLGADYARLLMASVDTIADRRTAEAAGWRWFGLGEPDTNSIECPAYTRGVTCAQCGLCAGTSRRARSIAVRPHGAGARHAEGIMEV